MKCVEFNELELKKLVYLYVINNAKGRPEDAIMSINSFIKDIKKGSPMIKALAVRTLGCLGVHKLNEYLVDIIFVSI